MYFSLSDLPLDGKPFSSCIKFYHMIIHIGSFGGKNHNSISFKLPSSLSSTNQNPKQYTHIYNINSKFTFYSYYLSQNQPHLIYLDWWNPIQLIHFHRSDSKQQRSIAHSDSSPPWQLRVWHSTFPWVTDKPQCISPPIITGAVSRRNGTKLESLFLFIGFLLTSFQLLSSIVIHIRFGFFHFL